VLVLAHTFNPSGSQVSRGTDFVHPFTGTQTTKGTDLKIQLL